jgi:hypothetical protein
MTFYVYLVQSFLMPLCVCLHDVAFSNEYEKDVSVDVWPPLPVVCRCGRNIEHLNVRLPFQHFLYLMATTVT